MTLELRENLPFVFVHKKLRSAGTTTTDIQRAVPVTFTLDKTENNQELLREPTP
jgi:hypothetical protein